MGSMERIRRVAVLGAGAMGGFLASRFCDATDFTTELIATGRYYERLTRYGLVVNGKEYRPAVVHPDDPGPAADFIIVALKHHQLEDAIRGLKDRVGSGTTIISVMNGLESEQIIGSVCGMDRMLYTISVGIDAVREGNRITYTKPGILYFGELRNPEPNQKVLRVREAFSRAQVPCEVPEDMERMLWWKLMINAGINQASAVLRAGNETRGRHAGESHGPADYQGNGAVTRQKTGACYMTRRAANALKHSKRGGRWDERRRG